MPFSGSCFIRTDQLDGETDWKLRLAVTSTQKTASVRPPSKLSNGADEDLLDLEASIYAEAPQKDIHSFIGKFSSKEHHREYEEPLSNFLKNYFENYFLQFINKQY
jgi:phospholipid-translocating ATPase